MTQEQVALRMLQQAADWLYEIATEEDMMNRRVLWGEIQDTLTVLKET